MKNSNHVAFRQYIIDTENFTYRAIWNCQVEWNDDCIFYDAETGIVIFADDEPEFVSDHPHKVTKDEYRQHVEDLQELNSVREEELKEMLMCVSVN